MRIVPTLQRGNAALDVPASIFVRQLGLNGLVVFWEALNSLALFCAITVNFRRSAGERRSVPGGVPTPEHGNDR